MVPPDSKGISPVPPYSGCPYVPTLYAYGAVTRSGWPSQAIWLPVASNKGSYNPGLAVTRLVWATPRSLATTGGITICFLFLRVLRCFSSPGWLLFRDSWSSTNWVAPFGHLRIAGYVRLPEAFRSLSRPSSPLRAKASPVRPL